MTRVAKPILVLFVFTCLLISAALLRSSIQAQERASGIVAQQYSGACQVMKVGVDGTVSYDDTPLAICHLHIISDEMLKAEFPDVRLGRGKWTPVTLKLVTDKPRLVWTAVVGTDTYTATAIPYSDKAYIFRLEITNNEKLLAGAQQFYAINPK